MHSAIKIGQPGPVLQTLVASIDVVSAASGKNSSIDRPKQSPTITDFFIRFNIRKIVENN